MYKAATAFAAGQAQTHGAYVSENTPKKDTILYIIIKRLAS